MAGAQKKRDKAKREEKRQAGSQAASALPGSSSGGGLPGAGFAEAGPSNAPGPSNVPSARDTTPFSTGTSSSAPKSLPRFDGNASRPGSPAGARPPSPGAAPRGPTRVESRNLDLGAGAWAAINELGSSNLPVRPASLNTHGQVVNIGLNSHKVLSYPKTTVYQYDVMVAPHADTKVDSTGIKRGLLDKIWKSRAVKDALGPGFVYDGNKLAWCMRNLEQQRIVVDLDVEQNRESRGRNSFKVQVRPVTTVDFTILDAYLAGRAAWDDKCLEAIAFLDHLMRETPRSKFFTFRRSFFSRQDERSALGGGIEVWKGVYASIRCAYNGPSVPRGLAVNIDIANSCFWTVGFLTVAMQQATGMQGLDESALQGRFTDAQRDWRRSSLYEGLKRLSRVKVQINHRGQVEEFVIDKFLPQTARQFTFEKDGTMISLENYFWTTYQRRPTLFLPVVQMTKKIGPPGKKTNVVFPCDMLTIAPNQRYTYKLSELQTAGMIKFAVTSPYKRLQDITKGVEKLGWGTDPYLSNYGVKIDERRNAVQGRVLPAPDVIFANGSIPASQAGQGRWRIDGKRFSTPNTTALISWGVCVLEGHGAADKPSVERFFQQFVQIARSHGMNIANTKPVMRSANISQGGKLVKAIWDATGNTNNKRPQILFFVLPGKNSYNYRLIKKSCDCRLGVVSQCLQSTHVMKNTAQYISNVCLKVNAKLGGTTCTAGSKLMPRLNPKFGNIPTMIIGADVSHAAPGVDDQGSFAAITMSLNKTLNRFAAHVQNNGPRVELITEKVWGEMRPMFEQWMKVHGGLPQRLIYLRDGLSEGQYQQCLDTEIGFLRKLLQNLQPNNVTKMTVIICSKRHHIRFFPIDDASGDKNANPKPGTLVETGVTHPFENDFYLCSHSAIKGTARPIHFHVLKNDCEMSQAEMQQMLYESSYTYARATTPVSLPPAVYYAHLASNRAIAHIDKPTESAAEAAKQRANPQPPPPQTTHTGSLAEKPLLELFHEDSHSIKYSMWYI